MLEPGVPGREGRCRLRGPLNIGQGLGPGPAEGRVAALVLLRKLSPPVGVKGSSFLAQEAKGRKELGKGWRGKARTPSLAGGSWGPLPPELSAQLGPGAHWCPRCNGVGLAVRGVCTQGNSRHRCGFCVSEGCPQQDA